MAPAQISVTVDVVLESSGGILFVKRRNEPFAGRWALPGGYVETDEDLPAAAFRELKEETGVDLAAAGVGLTQLGAYGSPGRDPRGRTVSIVFIARAGGPLEPIAADDAAEARFFQRSALPAPDQLAFDHALILKDALNHLASPG